jgi:hypothetical protein
LVSDPKLAAFGADLIQEGVRLWSFWGEDIAATGGKRKNTGYED